MNERTNEESRRCPSTSARSSNVGASLVRRTHALTKRAICVHAEARAREQRRGAQGCRVRRLRTRGTRKSRRVVFGAIRGWYRCNLHIRILTSGGEVGCRSY